MVTTEKPRCPEVITKSAGDESMDYCNLHSGGCVLVSGEQCPIYNDYLAKQED